MEDQQFYVGQKAFIYRDGELLILIDPLLGPDMPGGKIQEGETDLEAAFRREVREETQLNMKIGSPFHTWIWTIQKKGHRNFGKKIFMISYHCTYVSGEIKLSDEHSEYYWVTKDNYESKLAKYWDENNSLCKVIDLYFMQM